MTVVGPLTESTAAILRKQLVSCWFLTSGLNKRLLSLLVVFNAKSCEFGAERVYVVTEMHFILSVDHTSVKENPTEDVSSSLSTTMKRKEKNALLTLFLVQIANVRRLKVVKIRRAAFFRPVVGISDVMNRARMCGKVSQCPWNVTSQPCCALHR